MKLQQRLERTYDEVRIVARHVKAPSLLGHLAALSGEVGCLLNLWKSCSWFRRIVLHNVIDVAEFHLSQYLTTLMCELWRLDRDAYALAYQARVARSRVAQSREDAA